MVKSEASRAEELKDLGWAADEVRRYSDLWEYRQRWGAINLEPEDRAFLRKAEAQLPKLPANGRGSARKSTREKSHYRWLALYLEAMKADAPQAGLAAGEEAAWPIVLEEELRALAYYEPVLGLPDTLKARTFQAERERWIQEATPLGRTLSFDFAAPLAALQAQGGTNWKPLRGERTDNDYPVLDAEAARSFRSRVRSEVVALVRSTLPSLKDSDKPEPPEDWQPPV